MKTYILNAIACAVVVTSLRAFGLPGFIVGSIITGCSIYFINRMVK